MTFGCAGHNDRNTLMKKLDWKTRTFKGIHLATFDRRSKSGLDIRCIHTNAIDSYNERPKHLRSVIFKPVCADVIANHRMSPGAMLGMDSNACGEIAFLRTTKVGHHIDIVGDFTLDGPKARLIAELLEEDNPGFQLFFSPKVIVTDVKDSCISKQLVSITTFKDT